MKITIVSGSARTNNNTIRVGKAIERLHAGDTVNLIDFITYDIPLLASGDIHLDNLTPFQSQLMAAMHEADIIYIITPEYNWSTTPEILNWLHRFGERQFKQLFQHKVFALVGVSTGKGGKAPVLHLTGILNKIISYMDLDSMVSAKIFESHYTKEVLDENGFSKGNAEYDAGLNAFISYTNRMANRWHQVSR